MVIIGYGSYRNYTIQQVPNTLLSELAEKYRLSHDAQTHADYAELQITIAIHEGIQRRQGGGSPLSKEPSAKEMATKLIAKGYQALSKDHHPDRKGGSDAAQKTLNTVRIQLLHACEDIQDQYFNDALVIPDPTPASSPISDEDIPF